ncbi:hypothetical protein [Aggregatibacter segnis]|uniref:hypothetical protein n=1 Tax=Aggregatibacter segnis TaxID=739 RepID=UPI003FA08B5D
MLSADTTELVYIVAALDYELQKHNGKQVKQGADAEKYNRALTILRKELDKDGVSVRPSGPSEEKQPLNFLQLLSEINYECIKNGKSYKLNSKIIQSTHLALPKIVYKILQKYNF